MLLKIKGLRYPASSGKLLKNVELSLKKEEKLVLLGASGSGKSTLLELICGFRVPFEGSMQLLKMDFSSKNIHPWRKKIAYVPQETQLDDVAVFENILLPWNLSPQSSPRPDKHRIAGTLKSLGLSSKILEQPAGSLSGGEKRRVVLARAILLERPLLLLDEPTSGLDEENIRLVMEAICGLRVAAIIATHEKEAAGAIPRKLILGNGEIIKEEQK